MNNFAVVNIEELEELSGPGASFYSVKFENKQINEFESWTSKFIHEPQVKTEFDDLYSWLSYMAQHGIRREVLRNERKAQALPPQAEYLSIEYNQNLRLYCLYISEKAMFLFNGAVKTKNTAQECPKVRPHFETANKLATEINRLILLDKIMKDSTGNLTFETKTIRI